MYAVIFFKSILLLSLFLIPLFGAIGDFGYEQIKILFFIVSTTLIAIVWLLKKPKLKWTLIKAIAFIFIFVLFVTSVFGADRTASFIGREPYFQGWVVYAYLFVFSIVITSLDIKLRTYALVLSSSAIIVSLLGVVDWVLSNFFSMEVPTYAGRVVSTFGQPNFYAGFLLLTLPFSYFLIRSTNKKISYFGIVSGLISFAGIFVSFSRSAILLALILLILALFSFLSSPRMRGSINNIISWIPAFAGMTVLVLALVGNEFIKPLETKNPDLTKDSVEKRAYIWPQAVTIAWQRPFSGYGLENISQAFNNYFVVNKHSLFEENLNISPVLISLKELNIDRSHNYLLDLLLFSGILGLSGWLGFIWVLFGRARNVLLVSLITYLVWTQFQNQSIVHLIYFWLLVGLIDRKLSAAY